MKYINRFFVALGLMAAGAVSGYAQDSDVAGEEGVRNFPFESYSLQWAESYGKNYSASVVGDALTLENKKDDTPLNITLTTLPIDPEVDFSITSKIKVSRLGCVFAIVFNYTDERNHDIVAFGEDGMGYDKVRDGRKESEFVAYKKMKSFTKEFVAVTIVREGSSIIVNVDGAEIFFQGGFAPTSPKYGYALQGKGVMSVTGLSTRQVLEDD